MYNPNEDEKKVCDSIVRGLVKGKEDIYYERIEDAIFQMAYSIGGDYSENTLREVAKIIIGMNN